MPAWRSREDERAGRRLGHRKQPHFPRHALHGQPAVLFSGLSLQHIWSVQRNFSLKPTRLLAGSTGLRRRREGHTDQCVPRTVLFPLKPPSDTTNVNLAQPPRHSSTDRRNAPHHTPNQAELPFHFTHSTNKERQN